MRETPFCCRARKHARGRNVLFHGTRYAIGILPEGVLRKVYWENAARLLGLGPADFE